MLVMPSDCVVIAQEMAIRELHWILSLEIIHRDSILSRHTEPWRSAASNFTIDRGVKRAKISRALSRRPGKPFEAQCLITHGTSSLRAESWGRFLARTLDSTI
jgi:hypothetical protein